MAGIGYDAISEGYDELYGVEQVRKYRMALGRVGVGGLSGWVADVGCGTGLLLSFLRTRGCDVEYVGLDVSEAMLLKALGRADSQTHLIQADGNNLPLRDRAVNTVFSFTAIHHLNPAQFAAEASRTATNLVVVSQHKRLKPRLNIEPVDEEVDELIITSPQVLRKAAGGPCGGRLPRAGHAGPC